MIEFLSRVWGEDTGYGFLPRKTDRWIEPAPILYPQHKPGTADLDTDADLYFAPLLFTEPRRLKENAKPSRWLFADLDAVNPRNIPLLPTIAWQTSPGRYQALWELDSAVEPPFHSSLNRRLTYKTGADKGGWHLTKVLRIPGSYNYKYDRPHRVRTLWNNGPVYSVRKIEDWVGDVPEDREPEIPQGLLLPLEDAKDIVKRMWERFGPRVKELLSATRAEVGERSERLWELECRLLESGLEPAEVFVVVRESVWNKFAERERADEQLWTEIRKAHMHVGSASEETFIGNGGVTRVRPRIVTYSDILGYAGGEPDWLIEDWWTLGSHGVIAGLPKSYKSLVTLDIAVSTASETPFLNQYEVNSKGAGPVLIVQQENSLALVKDRLLKITQARGLQVGEAKVAGDAVVMELPPALPLYFFNDFTFDLTFPDDRQAVEDTIQKYGIRMVIFDPLYLMIGGADENKAAEMRPILSWLLALKNRYKCAVIVVHHWGKGSVQSNPQGGRGLGGIKLLGSTTIYGWLEAAMYLEAHEREDGIEVVIEREFRERLSPPPIGFHLNMGDIGESTYEWSRKGSIGTDNRLLWLLDQTPDGITYETVMQELEIGRKKAVDVMNQLVATGEVITKTENRTKRFYIKED